MKRSVQKKSSSKQQEVITISDDDDDDDIFNIKAEASISPATSLKLTELKQKVAELQQKVVELEKVNAKLEKDFQGACRMAGEAKERVEFLEKLVDTKPYIVKCAVKEGQYELKKEVKDLTAQLEAKKELEQRVNDLTSQLEEKKGLEERLAEVSGMLDTSRNEAEIVNNKNDELHRAMEALKLEKEEMRSENDALKLDIAEKQRLALLVLPMLQSLKATHIPKLETKTSVVSSTTDADGAVKKDEMEDQ